MDSRWVQVTPSEFPWERDALAFLERRLPDHEPYHVWANFEFLLDGTIGEVDALVVAPKGIFLIEIKSWPGLLEGDAGTWRNTRPGAVHARTLDNPLLLANRKAKRLKSLLMRQRAFRGEQVPFVRPLVFLSSPELDCRLAPDARNGVHGLDIDDPHDAPTQRGGLSGIVKALTSMSSEERERLGERRIDKPMAKRIAAALEQAGVRPAQRRRQVGDLELGELIDEGPGYQDFEASNPRFAHTHRRVRIYGTPDMASAEQRAQASRAAQREFELLAPVEYPGIVRAIAFHELELGPAIVFERDPGSAVTSNTSARLTRTLRRPGCTRTLRSSRKPSFGEPSSEMRSSSRGSTSRRVATTVRAGASSPRRGTIRATSRPGTRRSATRTEGDWGVQSSHRFYRASAMLCGAQQQAMSTSTPASQSSRATPMTVAPTRSFSSLTS